MDVDLVQLVDESFGLMSIRGAERGLAMAHLLAPDVPATALGDPMRLRQVLINLLGNAIKFTEKGSVTLCVEVEQADGARWLRFTVADTGMGIGEDAQARLFNRYVQAGTWVSRKFGGTGLGLSICRQLVELMGGEIGVVSQPGAGSRFWFRVPLLPASHPGERTRPAHAPARVLLLESDPTVRGLLARQLAGWGSQVVEVDAEAAAQGGQAGDVLLIGGRLPAQASLALAARSGLPAVVLTPAGTLGQSQPDQALAVVPEPARETALATALDGLAEGRAKAAKTPLPATAKPAPQPQAKGLTVLVVDDNLINRRVADAMLSRRGHTVQSADDGAKAVEMVAADPPDLVLMDRHMPVMDGVAAVRAIRALPAPACNVPVVALTAAASSEEVQECLSAGMDDFVPKPFSLEQLEAAMQRVVGARDRGAGPDFDPEVMRSLRASLGEDEVAELVPQYLSLAQTAQGKLASAASMRDGMALAEAARGLRSASQQIGLQGVAQLCHAIEAAIREGRLEEAVSLADQVPAACARGRAQLRHL
jgi:CheY-like chemotaxis protein